MPAPANTKRAILFDNFEDALAEVDHLLVTPYERCGKWDLGQICDHLGDAFEGSMRGYDFAAPWIITKLFAKPVLRQVLEKHRIPFTPRIPKRLVPLPGKDPRECAARLREKVSEFRAWKIDLARHPFFGKLTYDQWRQIHLLHLSHHLSFLVPQSADVTVDTAPDSQPTDRSDRPTDGGAIL